MSVHAGGFGEQVLKLVEVDVVVFLDGFDLFFDGLDFALLVVNLDAERPVLDEGHIVQVKAVQLDFDAVGLAGVASDFEAQAVVDGDEVFSAGRCRWR